MLKSSILENIENDINIYIVNNTGCNQKILPPILLKFSGYKYARKVGSAASSWIHFCNTQAGAELGQAQIKLELGFTLIKILFSTELVHS